MTLALARMSLPRLILAIIVAGATAPAMAQTRLFRMATSADAGSLDPMASNAFFNYLPLLQVYEALVHRGDDMRVGPGLAHRWERLESMRWRFHLRDGVRFAGGETFSADDVAFSLRRAAAPTSNINVYLDTLDRVDVVDRLTVDLVTRVSDAVLPNKLFSVAIMSRAWAEANGVARAPNATQREETHATRNANGTAA